MLVRLWKIAAVVTTFPGDAAHMRLCRFQGLSHYACFVKGPWVLGKQELGQANTPTQNLVMMISFGYFVFDFAWCMAMGSEPLMTFLHHVASGVRSHSTNSY